MARRRSKKSTLARRVAAWRKLPKKALAYRPPHSSVFVIEDVAMKHEVASVAAIGGAHGNGRALFDNDRVLPDALEVEVLAGRVLRQILSAVADRRNHLERVDVDVKRMRRAGDRGLERPVFDRTECQRPIRPRWRDLPTTS